MPAPDIRALLDLDLAPQALSRIQGQVDRAFRGFRGRRGQFALGQISRDVNLFGRSLEAAEARVLSFGATIAIFAGIPRLIKAIGSEFINLDKRLREINVILNASPRQIKQFGQDLFNIARQTAQSFDTVSQAALEFSRQGLGISDTLKRTKDALILVRLSGLDAATAVSSLTAAINTFEDEALTSTEIVNKLIKVDQNYAVSSRDLADALSKTSSSAQDAKVTFDELLAAVTAVKQRTALSGNIIGTAFKTIFARIQRPEALKQLESFGIAVRDLEGNTLPAIQILTSLADKFKTLTDVEKSSLAQIVGGTRQLNVLSSLLRDLSKDYGIFTGALNDANTATDEAIRRSELLNQSISAQGTRTINTLKEAAAGIGELAGKPILERLFGTGEDFGNILKFVTAGEGFGAKIGKGILKGLGDSLSSVGLILGGTLLAKLTAQITGRAIGSFGSILQQPFFGKKARTEQEIVNFIRLERDYGNDILRQGTTRQQQEKTLLALIRERVLQAERLAVIERSLAASVSGQVLLRGGVLSPKIPNKADGVLPAIIREQKAINRGVGGAGANARPVLKTLNIGGGRTPAIVNTHEKIVRNFMGSGQDAVFNKGMINSVGGNLGRFGRIENITGGGVPNFATARLLGVGSFGEFYQYNKRPNLGFKKFTNIDDLRQDFHASLQAKIRLNKDDLVTAPSVFGTLERAIEKKRIGKQVVSSGDFHNIYRRLEVATGRNTIAASKAFNLLKEIARIGYGRAAKHGISVKDRHLGNIGAFGNIDKFVLDTISNESNFNNTFDLTRPSLSGPSLINKLKESGIKLALLDTARTFASGSIPNLASGLYHTAKFVPPGLLESLQGKQIQIKSIESHAAKEILRDKYNSMLGLGFGGQSAIAKTVQLSHTLDKSQIFEIAADAKNIQKIAFRKPVPGTTLDRTYVVSSDGRLLTTWLNRQSDAHQTLDLSRYANAAGGIIPNFAGYDGYSMSNNARLAYLNGELPASKAYKEFGFKSAKALREAIRPSSWHHTSKKYNQTDFFNIEESYQDFELDDFNRLFPKLNKKGKSIAAEFVRNKIKENIYSDQFNEIVAHRESGFFRDRNRKFKLEYGTNKLIPNIATGLMPVNQKFFYPLNKLNQKRQVEFLSMFAAKKGLNLEQLIQKPGLFRRATQSYRINNPIQGNLFGTGFMPNLAQGLTSTNITLDDIRNLSYNEFNALGPQAVGQKFKHLLGRSPIGLKGENIFAKLQQEAFKQKPLNIGGNILTRRQQALAPPISVGTPLQTAAQAALGNRINTQLFSPAEAAAKFSKLSKVFQGGHRPQIRASGLVQLLRKFGFDFAPGPQAAKLSRLSQVFQGGAGAISQSRSPIGLLTPGNVITPSTQERPDVLAKAQRRADKLQKIAEFDKQRLKYNQQIESIGGKELKVFLRKERIQERFNTTLRQGQDNAKAGITLTEKQLRFQNILINQERQRVQLQTGLFEARQRAQSAFLGFGSIGRFDRDIAKLKGLSSEQKREGRVNLAETLRQRRAQRGIGFAFGAPILFDMLGQFGKEGGQIQRGIAGAGRGIGTGGLIASLTGFSKGGVIAGSVIAAGTTLKSIIDNLTPSFEELANKARELSSKQQAQIEAVGQITQIQQAIDSLTRRGVGTSKVGGLIQQRALLFRQIEEPLLLQAVRAETVEEREDLLAKAQIRLESKRAATELPAILTRFEDENAILIAERNMNLLRESGYSIGRKQFSLFGALEAKFRLKKILGPDPKGFSVEQIKSIADILGAGAGFTKEGKPFDVQTLQQIGGRIGKASNLEELEKALTDLGVDRQAIESYNMTRGFGENAFTELKKASNELINRLTTTVRNLDKSPLFKPGVIFAPIIDNFRKAFISGQPGRVLGDLRRANILQEGLSGIQGRVQIAGPGLSDINRAGIEGRLKVLGIRTQSQTQRSQITEETRTLASNFATELGDKLKGIELATFFETQAGNILKGDPVEAIRELVKIAEKDVRNDDIKKVIEHGNKLLSQVAIKFGSLDENTRSQIKIAKDELQTQRQIAINTSFSQFFGGINTLRTGVDFRGSRQGFRQSVRNINEFTPEAIFAQRQAQPGPSLENGLALSRFRFNRRREILGMNLPVARGVLAEQESGQLLDPEVLRAANAPEELINRYSRYRNRRIAGTQRVLTEQFKVSAQDEALSRFDEVVGGGFKERFGRFFGRTRDIDEIRGLIEGNKFDEAQKRIRSLTNFPMTQGGPLALDFGKLQQIITDLQTQTQVADFAANQSILETFKNGNLERLDNIITILKISSGHIPGTDFTQSRGIALPQQNLLSSNERAISDAQRRGESGTAVEKDKQILEMLSKMDQILLSVIANQQTTTPTSINGGISLDGSVKIFGEIDTTKPDVGINMIILDLQNKMDFVINNFKLAIPPRIEQPQGLQL